MNSIKQRYIYKIESSRLKRNNWDMNLSVETAKESGELISIADSQVLRFIRDIKGTSDDYIEYNELKRQLKSIKKDKTNTEGTRRVKEINSSINNILVENEYMTVVMQNNSDFDRANKGFVFNKRKYKRLLATTGGVKNNTVVYVSEGIYDELNRRLNNGRNINKELVPAKLEAYKSLACSASTPMDFNPLINVDGVDIPRVAVIDDCITEFDASVIKLDINTTTPPNVIHDDKHHIELESNDGFGFISPKLSKNWTKQLNTTDTPFISSGYCIRNSFCKGMLFTFDFHEFANKVADQEVFIDAWNNPVNVNDVDIILTTSMLKLHDSYESMIDYLHNCISNGYQFSVTTMIPKELENSRHLNYQFIQSLHLDDDGIKELVRPTVDDFEKILADDYRMALLFLRGTKLHDDSVINSSPDIAKAMMINKEMFHDPFVKSTIHKMISKKIQDAKVGVLSVDGNFSTISGDPYLLAESMFGLEPKGLLDKGEFYSAYWNERQVDRVAAFRAPMTCHNNIRMLNLKSGDDITRDGINWYQYMNRCTILNGWDTTTHAENGCDFDGDTFFTTNNPTVLNGIEEDLAIVCVQDSVSPIVPTEEDLIESNKNGFGDEIGAVTNKITSMFTVRARYERNSPEYQELENRIMWGQHYQQMAIDKIKGIEGAPMPKEWFSYYANMNHKDDSEATKEKKRFNIKTLADKKPYFMSYIYPRDRREYNEFIRKTNRNSLVRFGMSVDELFGKKDKTKDEKDFIKYYNIKMPLNTYPCIMNKICYEVENRTDGMLSEAKQNKHKFDKNILKNKSVDYKPSVYKRVKKLHDEYKGETQKYMVASSSTNNTNNSNDSMTVEERRLLFAKNFREKALELCNNEDELCNIVVDLCYDTNESKQFAWDLCGGTIVNNLLRESSGCIKYPSLDDDGDIEFNGMTFSMKETYIGGEVFNSGCN